MITTPPAPAAERAIVLHAATHDTCVTELRGLFSVYCGCGFKAQDKPIGEIHELERAHLAAVGTVTVARFRPRATEGPTG